MKRHTFVLSLLLLLLFTCSSLADTTVTFIDVGHGDAIWIHDDTGHDVLIDGGSRDRAATGVAAIGD